MQVVSADAHFRADEVSVARAVGGLLQVVRESLQLEVVFIGQITNGRRYFRHINTALAEPPIRDGDSHEAEHSICQRVLDGRLPAIIPCVRDITREHGLSPEYDCLRAHIGVPVHLPNGRVYGMLCGFNLRDETGALNSRDVKRMQIAAEAAARLLAQAEGNTGEAPRATSF